MTAPPRTHTANAHAPGLTTQSLAPRLDAPSVAAALPVPATESGPIAVFDRPNYVDEATSAARHWRFPFRLLSFVIVVAMPTILAGVYYFFIAADQYVAEFRFALRAVEPVRGEIAGIFQPSAAPSPVSVDSHAVVQYLGSRDIIDDLAKTLDLREDVLTLLRRLVGASADASLDRGAGQILEKPGRCVLRRNQWNDRR